MNTNVGGAGGWTCLYSPFVVAFQTNGWRAKIFCSESLPFLTADVFVVSIISEHVVVDHWHWPHKKKKRDLVDVVDERLRLFESEEFEDSS